MDRYSERRETLRRNLAASDAEAFLVNSAINVRYLAGFTGDSSVLLLAPDRDLLISDGRFATQIAQECPALETYIRPVGSELNHAIAQMAAKVGLRRLAFEATNWTVSDHESIREAAPGIALVGVKGWVEGLRRIKDEEEIAAIREAVRCAERAFTMMRAGLREGDTEKDVADALENYLRRCGATAASFPPIVAVGVNAALPHARPTSTARVGDDDFVLIDWGASGQPYKSDLTRVLVTGKVTPKFETIYRIVLAAQERAISAIRPGAPAQQIDALARSVIEDAGYGDFFDHGLGHGLGMEIHEAPRLRMESPDRLEPGMVVTVEPGIYLPNWGGIRIEDDVLVTPDGHEVLSHIPKSLDSVRIE
jgi:Xaa-Pro aminopeptidase